MSFLRLPVEIRLAIYEELFGQGITSVNGGRQDTGAESQSPSLLPATGQIRAQYRSAQMLRTCKTILAEARPILYDHTVFRTAFQAFAGRLPVQMTTGHPTAPEVRHLEWHLNCDLLKKYDPADVHIASEDIKSLQSVQLVCQAANWREPIGAEWCDKEIFVRGRQQVLDFAKGLQMNMSIGTRKVTLVEDVRSLSRGRVVMRIFQGNKNLTADVRALDDYHTRLQANSAQEIEIM